MWPLTDERAVLGVEGFRRYRRYRSYRDTGLAWPCQVPVHWDVVRIKRVCRLAYGEALASDTRVDGAFDVYGSNGAVGTHECPNTFGPCLIVGRKGSFGKVNYSEQPVFVIDTAYLVDARTTPHDVRWLYYLLLHAALDSATKDSAIPGLDREDVYARDVCVCPPDEQHAIASFLDRETARIDALAAKKERLIQLLQEQRTALITHAVTTGLEPNVPLKDSGVEWLREIPEHWAARRIKWMAKMVSGHTPDKKVESYWLDGDIPWVSLADTKKLRDSDYIADTTWMTTADGIANSSAQVLPEGTVIFSRDATIGLCAITRLGMAVSQHFIGWVCGQRVLPEYLLLVLRSMGRELERLSMGATVRTIGMPDVKSLVMPVPPLEEQKAIVDFVRGERSRIDALIAKVREAIDHLKELRSALISAAVTGKIDVREEVG